MTAATVLKFALFVQKSFYCVMSRVMIGPKLTQFQDLLKPTNNNTSDNEH